MVRGYEGTRVQRYEGTTVRRTILRCFYRLEVHGGCVECNKEKPMIKDP